MSCAETRGIEVRVTSRYHPDQSSPTGGRWFFSYAVHIANRGDETVQLVARTWVITNAHGEQEEVRGEGVVGEQPVLAPGDAFAYTSFCPLDTSMGAMHGSFAMVTPEGDRFEAEIAPFTLADPDTLN